MFCSPGASPLRAARSQLLESWLFYYPVSSGNHLFMFLTISKATDANWCEESQTPGATRDSREDTSIHSCVITIVQPNSKGWVSWRVSLRVCYMIEKYQIFGATKSPNGILHLLCTVQTHTGSSYRFSAGTTALLLHFLIWKKKNKMDSSFSKKNRKPPACGRIRAVSHIAWLK